MSIYLPIHYIIYNNITILQYITHVLIAPCVQPNIAAILFSFSSICGQLTKGVKSRVFRPKTHCLVWNTDFVLAWSTKETFKHLRRPCWQLARASRSIGRTRLSIRPGAETPPRYSTAGWRKERNRLAFGARNAREESLCKSKFDGHFVNVVRYRSQDCFRFPCSFPRFSRGPSSSSLSLLFRMSPRLQTWNRIARPRARNERTRDAPLVTVHLRFPSANSLPFQIKPATSF